MLSVFLYGAECWRTVNPETNQLNAYHNSCLRIFWPIKISSIELYSKIISNVEMYSKTSAIVLKEKIKYKRLRWLGHVFRMEQNRFPKSTENGIPPLVSENRDDQK